MNNETEKEIDDLLTRGVGNFTDPEGKFKEKLLKKVRGEYEGDIVVKLGVDPTRPDIHLGHAVIFRKLRKFQELGCKAVFLVGDFTTLIGDPTGKSKVRPEIDQKEIEANMKTFIDQVGKILIMDKTKFSWIRNSDWFTAITDLGFPKDKKVNVNIKKDGQELDIPLDANSFMGKSLMFERTRMQIQDVGLKERVVVITLRNFLSALRRVTYNHLINRDMFRERINAGKELYMHEMMYPVLQGIDSQAIAEIYGSCDLEMGGTDQTFNMLMGRDMMKARGQEPQSVISFELLTGMDGTKKMSKSEDNYIGINDEPEEMFGKCMSVPDNLMPQYFELCTYTPTSDIEEIKKSIESGKAHPRDIKLRLAKEIVSIYHGEAAAQSAEQNFINTFTQGGVPDDVRSVEVQQGEALVDVLVREGYVSSKSDFKRLVSGHAVEEVTSGEEVKDPSFKIDTDGTFKVGKKIFVKVVVSD